MINKEAEFEMVRRHVAQGERHIAQQKEIIARLHKVGGSTAIARGLLEDFENTLAAHSAHLARLEAELNSN